MGDLGRSSTAAASGCRSLLLAACPDANFTNDSTLRFFCILYFMDVEPVAYYLEGLFYGREPSFLVHDARSAPLHIASLYWVRSARKILHRNWCFRRTDTLEASLFSALCCFSVTPPFQKFHVFFSRWYLSGLRSYSALHLTDHVVSEVRNSHDSLRTSILSGKTQKALSLFVYSSNSSDVSSIRLVNLSILNQ